jgi:hypothetical protein
MRTGRTLEETAALFDGEQPQQDLARLGGHAATMASRGAVGRAEKVTIYSNDMLLELRQSYASQLTLEQQKI